MATPSNLQDQITCTICKRTFKSPVKLPCQHTYCMECMSTIAAEGNVNCPQCDKTCSKHQCVEDKKAQQLIDLFDTCTDGKKQRQQSSKIKFHLPKRISSTKKSSITDVKEKKLSIEGHNTGIANAVEKSYGDDPVLTKASQRRSTVSSTSSSDSDREPCHICMKHGMKWVCMKCNFKACDPCSDNFPLLCKDQTKNHTFVDADCYFPETEPTLSFQFVSNKTQPANDPEYFSKIDECGKDTDVSERVKRLAEMNTESVQSIIRKVTFLELDSITESSSDEYKPRFRDSIALTKDKKDSLEEIIGEVNKIEESATATIDSLKLYHTYMKDVKVAGFTLIDQTEQLMIDKINQFFNGLRKDYAKGFDEMTVVSEQLNRNLEDNLHKIQGNAAILEEITENNDTRALLDEEFLSDKCGELDNDIAEIGKDIVQCKRVGLQDSKEWDEKAKVQFEKEMNVRILTAAENEMSDKLFPEMANTIDKLKPVLGNENKDKLKRKKLLECVIA